MICSTYSKTFYNITHVLPVLLFLKSHEPVVNIVIEQMRFSLQKWCNTNSFPQWQHCFSCPWWQHNMRVKARPFLSNMKKFWSVQQLQPFQSVWMAGRVHLVLECSRQLPKHCSFFTAVSSCLLYLMSLCCVCFYYAVLILKLASSAPKLQWKWKTSGNLIGQVLASEHSRGNLFWLCMLSHLVEGIFFPCNFGSNVIIILFSFFFGWVWLKSPSVYSCFLCF